MSTPDLTSPQRARAHDDVAWRNPYEVAGDRTAGPAPHPASARTHPQEQPFPYAQAHPFPHAQGQPFPHAQAQPPAQPFAGPHPSPWPTPHHPYGGGVRPAAHGPNGLAIAGLVLGAVALPLLGVATGLVSGAVAVVGVALGIGGLAMARRPGTGGRGTAVAGVLTSAVSAVLALTVLAVSGTVVGDAIAAEVDALLGAGEYELPVVALRPGEWSTVGDYAVTVEEIQVDADAAVAARPGNPAADGRYVQAVVTVVYEGTTHGVVEEDLLVSYAGSNDEWVYEEWTCAATTDRPVWDLGRLEPGQEATWTACMDVPVDVLRDTAVIVEDLTTADLAVELWGER